MKNRKYKCAVNGRFRRGNMIGLCPYMMIRDNSICGAHGNKKCEHKIKIKEIK